MSLLESVLGAVINKDSDPSNLNWMQLASALMNSEGALGGLSGLIEKFNAAGLGHIVASWIAKGPNLPISAAQIQDVLGSDLLGHMAEQLGLSPSKAGAQLSNALPALVDTLSPGGTIPAEGLGELEDVVTRVLGRLQLNH